MLIGGGSSKPNIQRIRAIKRCLREALELPEDAIITVTQLACLEKGCAPLETVIGLRQVGKPRLQAKIHKTTDALLASHLHKVRADWGHDVRVSKIQYSMQRSK